jgi:hypothetical protein
MFIVVPDLWHGYDRIHHLYLLGGVCFCAHPAKDAQITATSTYWCGGMDGMHAGVCDMAAGLRATPLSQLQLSLVGNHYLFPCKCVMVKVHAREKGEWP